MVKASARLVGVTELMDSPDAEWDELARMLKDLAWINRFLGGVRVVRSRLAPLLLTLPAPIRILEVGTGMADIPRALVRWTRARGLPLEVEAVDHHERIAKLAQRASEAYPEIRVYRADALALPFSDGSFDVVLASLILHHLEGEESVRLLGELHRVARHAVIVNDLRRGRWPFLVTWASLHLLSRSGFIRHDGPLSVRRGFLAHELLELAHAAGWPHARVSRQLFFRLALVGVKGGVSFRLRSQPGMPRRPAESPPSRTNPGGGPAPGHFRLDSRTPSRYSACRN